ncbi:hypothetical protein NIES2101_41610 [Calothrix sp. HK-06]|nr:hypothetical protein NIES2101_41610 [Calothrix sp. HK-06]
MKNFFINPLEYISIILIKKIVFCFFAITFTIRVINLFLMQKFISTYVYEDWLINYSQGFVRRGFSGSILLFLNNNYSLDTFQVFRWFSYLIFLVFCGIYLLKVKQSKQVLDLKSLMVVLFLPSLIFFPLHDRNVIGRKELLFFFGLFINIFFVEKTVKALNINQNFEYEQDKINTINKYCYNLFISYNFFSVPTALIHESILFLSLPLNIVITSTLLGLKLSIKQVSLRTLTIYSPTIFAAVLCFIFQGNESSPVEICQSWQENINAYKSINCDPSHLPLVLRYIGLPVRYFIMEVWRNNIYRHNGLVFLKWISAFLLCTIILMRTSSIILSNSLEKLKRKNQWQYQDEKSLESFSKINLNNVISNFSFKYAFIPFMFSFVLYIIAQDWGRWFFVTSTSYTICLLSPNLILLEIVSCQNNSDRRYKLRPRLLLPIYSIYSRISNMLCGWSLSIYSSILYFLAFVFTLFVLKIPHFGLDWDYSSFTPWIISLLMKFFSMV